MSTYIAGEKLEPGQLVVVGQDGRVYRHKTEYQTWLEKLNKLWNACLPTTEEAMEGLAQCPHRTPPVAKRP